MKLLIFGASGKVGQLIVSEALRRGHQVTAFIHSSPLTAGDGLRSVYGDIYDRASVEAAVAGQDAIVSALSSWGKPQKNVLSTTMQHIIPAAERSLLRRIVSLTGDAAQAPDEKVSVVKHGTHALLNFVAPKILRDSEDHIALLSSSSLDWTVLRSPVMTNGTRSIYALHKDSASIFITRTAVANAMIDVVEGNQWSKSAPYIRWK